MGAQDSKPAGGPADQQVSQPAVKFDWSVYVSVFSKEIVDMALPKGAGGGEDRGQKALKDRPRRLYPSGNVSLVPADYVPPPPKHEIVFDGKLNGRQLNVKNFYRHWCAFEDTEFNRGAVRVLEKLGRYRKPVWYTPMLASAAPIMVEHSPEYERESISDGDGGQIVLDWSFPGGSDMEVALVPTVMIFPGLAGHSGKDYIRSLCACITQQLRWRACVLNWRGFNKAPISKGKVFRPDDIGDMHRAISEAQKRFPHCRIYAVGFSAGSNQLIKYLGMNKLSHPISAAVSVCNGFEYDKHLQRLEQTTLGHSVYSRGMTYLHQEYLRTHSAELEEIEGFDLQKALNATKHSELDEALVCSLYGYTDVADYYKAIASRPWISHVNVPTLCMQSADDPLFTEGPVLTRDVLPVEDLHDNKHTIYFETELGSHLSFVEAEAPGGVSRHEHTFCDRAVLGFFQYANDFNKRYFF